MKIKKGMLDMGCFQKTSYKANMKQVFDGNWQILNILGNLHILKKGGE